MKISFSVLIVLLFLNTSIAGEEYGLPSEKSFPYSYLVKISWGGGKARQSWKGELSIDKGKIISMFYGDAFEAGDQIVSWNPYVWETSTGGGNRDYLFVELEAFENSLLFVELKEPKMSCKFKLSEKHYAIKAPGRDDKVVFDIIKKKNISKALKNKIRKIDLRNTKIISCRKIQDPPVIDGVLDDKCWLKAAKAENYELFNGLGLASEQTTSMILYDNKNLYIAFKCKEPKMGKLVAKRKKHDINDLWKDDHVEIFLLRNPEDKAYSHFMINADGVKFDELNMGGIAWNPEWEGKIGKDLDEWNVEIKIPFSELGGSPDDGDMWRINFARSEQDISENSSWSCCYSSFHKSSYWGLVFFGDYKPFFQKATLGKCLVGDNIFSCSLSNKTSEKKDLRIDLDLDSSHNKGAVCAKKTISLAPGQSSSVDLNYKINQGGEYSLKFRISDSGSGETIFRSSSYPISIPEINPVIKSLMLKTENAIKALGLGEEKDTGAAFSCQLEKLKDKLSTYANELKNVSDYSSWNLLKLKLDAVSRELDFVLNRIKCYKQAKKINKNVEYGVGVESSLRKVFKDEIFHGDLNPELSLSAASNEYESGQLVLIPFKNDLDDVTVKVSDLVHCDAPQNVIPESSIKWYAVDYVKTGMPGAYSSEKVGFWPDILMEKTPFSVKRDELRPVWITVYVPENTVPGKYRGVLTIAPANAPETKVPVSLKVWNFSIPKEASLPVTVSLSKWLLSQYYYGDYKRSFPIDAYRSFADMLLKHRISPFGIAVECIGPRGEFINKNLDLAGRELQFAFDNGLAAFQIAQYWHMRPPSAADLKRLKLFSEYLEGKGWLDKGSVYVTDEPPHSVFPIVKKMCEQIKKVNPQLKTAVTTAPSPELFGCIDIWITNFIHFDSRIANEIVKKGDEIWWYVCATQGNNPNLYIDFPALSHRLIFWLAWQNNVSGFLYYRANFWRNNYTGGDIEKRWPKTPWNPVSYMDIHGQKYNGDGYLLYPGPDMRPVNSIRLEVIRDGIEDYEYLHALQELTEKLSSEKNGNDVLLQRAKHILKAIKGSYDKNDQKHPEKVAKMIKDRESLGDCISAIRSSLDR